MTVHMSKDKPYKHIPGESADDQKSWESWQEDDRDKRRREAENKLKGEVDVNKDPRKKK